MAVGRPENHYRDAIAGPAGHTTETKGNLARIRAIYVQVANMTTIATCNTIDEALLLRSVLEGSGIAATVPDELTGQTAPPYLFATQTRVRLQVDEADEKRAREVLDQYAPEQK